MLVNERELWSNESMDAVVPPTNTQFTEQNVIVRVVVYWNSLSTQLKQAPSFQYFKSRLKDCHGFECSSTFS